ncbi:hypothetical protein SIAM614_21537 [Stappia aggregata IAM 12614]|uniref:TtsA-like Glycoside hydrolase family 108 domain-containing protein n=1 Tax=Roseibium aggregatum (strain ATCC 25650 / DSM 13394 / JCM 20685 / NBRC 16684 / NCIMB 2208 / IAM 12614 / B1) TaxID=384765 RepID=A0P342_ROSAI|nr:glycosyl hydrolase 108 family protein [Roseibium aggregatum]EAV40513.1 hypothetical protein SIAM614_21537 [Stappia aggregata IAM 12614] [Roseibium aggregatum IAM 12614]
MPVAIAPIVAVAASIVPGIIDVLLSEKDKKKSEQISESIANTINAVVGTTDPEEVRKRVSENAAMSDELRIELKKIEAEEKYKLRQQEIELKKLEQEDLEKRQLHEITLINTKIEEVDKTRQHEFEEFKARLGDVQDARQSFRDLVKTGNAIAWAPVIVSAIIVFGFFITILVLLSNTYDPSENDQVSQIVNIVIGALTAAFATVVSFWLGSSQGSRQKDVVNFEMQTQQNKLLRETQKYQADTRGTGISEKSSTTIINKQRTAYADESNFSKCVDLVLQYEGGYVKHPKDPGGATNLGITIHTLQNWRNDDVTDQDVKDLTTLEAKQIYQANYWNALKCDQLPLGVDLVVFDFGVNAGPGRSAKILQKVIGVGQDGIIGPISLKALEVVSPEHIVRRFSQLRMDYYRSLKNWDTFGAGWQSRTRKTEAEALKMVNSRTS